MTGKLEFTGVSFRPVEIRLYELNQFVDAWRSKQFYVPRNAAWLSDLRSELLSFPAGKHDDIVDALGLVGQLLDYMQEGRKPDPKPEKGKG